MPLRESILYGDGNSRSPHWIQGFRQEEGNLADMFAIADREGISKLKVAYSGRYYERRSDGWWETSDFDTCDKIHGLPKEGRPVGYSPIHGPGGAMVKKRKAWSMSAEAWAWLESQDNTSSTLRGLIVAAMRSSHQSNL